MNADRMNRKIYVTYDVDETGSGPNRLIYRVATEVPIQGELISWEVGEFMIRDVEHLFGVKLRYRPADGGPIQEEIVDTSGYAQNVQVFVGAIPHEYEQTLPRAA